MLAIEQVDRAAAHFPDRVAVTDGTLSYTYREIAALSSRIARALLTTGTPPGAHIAILSPNHVLVLACQYAILRAGCVWIPANYRNPARDTAQQFAKLDVTRLFYHSDLQEYVDTVCADYDGLDLAVPLERESGGSASLLDWMRTGDAAFALPPGGMDDVMFIGTTGGTTSGTVKGVVHTNRSWEANIANYYALHTFRRPPVHLVVAPLTHAAGVFHWGLVGLGATHVICPSAQPEVILDMIERFRVSILFLPPTIIYSLLSHASLRDCDLSSLEYLAFGSAPMGVEKLKEAAAVFGPVLYQAFGSTESLILNLCLRREELAEAVADPALAHRLASAGREGPFTRAEIMDEDGAILPPDTAGELVLRSCSVMKEYYRDPERTEAARAHGWHHTGDIARKDADGYVYLIDRKNDVIISGGFNIYPGEVEQAVLAHPAVQDCAVVGIPHDRWGEAVLATVELKPGSMLDRQEFLSFCRGKLGGVRAPKGVEIVPELPRSPVGKVLRRVVREPYWRDRSRSI